MFSYVLSSRAEWESSHNTPSRGDDGVDVAVQAGQAAREAELDHLALLDRHARERPHAAPPPSCVFLVSSTLYLVHMVLKVSSDHVAPQSFLFT